MTDIVIAAAARTPVGSFNGAFASLTAHDARLSVASYDQLGAN